METVFSQSVTLCMSIDLKDYLNMKEPNVFIGAKTTLKKKVPAYLALAKLLCC